MTDPNLSLGAPWPSRLTRLRRTSLGMSLVVLFCLCSAARSSPTDDCLLSLLRKEAIVSLAHSNSLVGLDRHYMSLPHRDTVLDLVYAMRRHELRPDTASGKLLLDAIPRNDHELHFFYSITFPGAFKDDPAVDGLFYSYLEELAKVVAGTRQGFREYLLLNRFADGEIATEVRSWTEFLLERDRTRFLQALKSLDPESRRRLCGECRILRNPKIKGLE